MTGLRRHLRDFAVSHVGGTAIVLIYHRVTRLERDPQLLAVSPENFNEQMRMLAERFKVVSLTELISGLSHRSIADGAVAVTFDDGYADNLLEAEPLLASHGIPATVFVSSGHVVSGREFWWDELESLVLAPGTLPVRIELSVPGGSYATDLEDSSTYSADEATRDRTWSVLEPATNARQRLYAELSAFLRPLGPSSRDGAIAQLRAAAGTSDAPSRPTHRPLTSPEVAVLASSPVIEVGAHTVNHPVLSTRTSIEQREEIVVDRDSLASMCGHPIRTFSYPYGSLDDYSHETVSIVRESGFRSACSNHPGVVKPWTDAYRLPRNLVRDWDAEHLADKIEGWLRGSL